MRKQTATPKIPCTCAPRPWRRRLGNLEPHVCPVALVWVEAAADRRAGPGAEAGPDPACTVARARGGWGVSCSVLELSSCRRSAAWSQAPCRQASALLGNALPERREPGSSALSEACGLSRAEQGTLAPPRRRGLLLRAHRSSLRCVSPGGARSRSRWKVCTDAGPRESAQRQYAGGTRGGSIVPPPGARSRSPAQVHPPAARAPRPCRPQLLQTCPPSALLLPLRPCCSQAPTQNPLFQGPKNQTQGHFVNGEPSGDFFFPLKAQIPPSP